MMKVIPNFKDYAITPQGEVYSFKSKRIIRPGKDKDGYLIVCLMKNKKKCMRRKGRLVGHAYHGRPRPGQTIEHSNGIRTDDRPKNLCWLTFRQNIRAGIERRKKCQQV